MDYEKKYKEALERAKEINNEHRAQPFDVMTRVFSELRKESADEKIRNALIDGLYECMSDDLGWSDFGGVPIEDLLAWLEKQGQTFTKKDVDNAYLKGVCDAKSELEKQSEQNPTWSEEDEKAIGLITIALEHPYDMEGRWDRKFALDWLKSLKDRMRGE